MPGGIFEKPPGHLVANGHLFQLPVRHKRGDLLRPGCQVMCRFLIQDRD